MIMIDKQLCYFYETPAFLSFGSLADEVRWLEIFNLKSRLFPLSLAIVAVSYLFVREKEFQFTPVCQVLSFFAVILC